jgi:hypothetical protein
MTRKAKGRSTVLPDAAVPGAPLKEASSAPSRRGRHRHCLVGAAVALATLLAPVALSAAPASAAVAGCSHGYVSGTKAWGTCTRGTGNWSLTVQCYYWGANTAYGYGPGSIYATCPDFSHITSITLRVQQ